MTLPDERYRAILWARLLLLDLVNPNKTKRIPKEIRQRAYSALRHFPTTFDMEETAEKVPEIFTEQMEDLHRFILKGKEE